MDDKWLCDTVDRELAVRSAVGKLLGVEFGEPFRPMWGTDGRHRARATMGGSSGWVEIAPPYDPSTARYHADVS